MTKNLMPQSMAQILAKADERKRRAQLRTERILAWDDINGAHVAKARLRRRGTQSQTGLLTYRAPIPY